MPGRKLDLTRKEFLFLSAAGLGGAALSGQRSLVGQGSRAVADTGPPDTILYGGKILTMDAADSTVQAVSIRSGLVVQTGTDAVVRSTAGPATVQIDLRGRTATPGMIDTHLHFQIVGLNNVWYTPFIPPAVKTIAELQAALTNFLKTLPAGEWFNGYHNMSTMPTRKDLDPVSPNHPVWIIHQPGHIGSCNSKALQLAGITASTPNPPGGIIEHDSAGEPTGVFYNHVAMDLVRRYAPQVPMEIQRKAIVETQKTMAALGVTYYHDNNVRGADTIKTYFDLARENRLFLPGSVSLTLEYAGELTAALGVEHYSDSFMRFAGFKFLIDGQAPMAYCYEPHNGVSWTTTTWDPTKLKQTVKTLHDAGLQICVHCVGDRSVDLVLDAYEAAMNANPRPDPRHRIEHCILTKPASTQRIKDLGVVISAQPQFLRYAGDGYVSIFGEQRMERLIVTREWLEAGIPVALGSDGPTLPWNSPGAALGAAISRTSATNRVIGASQIMTIREAIRAHTRTAAYAVFQEKIRGSLEPGKAADVIVWTNDPLTATPANLLNGTVDLTLIGGRVVFPDAAAASWILPSSARVSGQGGAFYTTDLTVANTGTVDAAYTLKFLGNNTDGRTGAEKSYALSAGKSVTYADVLSQVFQLTSGWGAIQVKADSSALAVLSQTSTPGAGGTFGQSVPGFGPPDLIANGTPRSILAVREDARFRTNLMLANANETTVAIDVSAVAESGAVLGQKQYTLSPLGMTQVSRVVRELGVTGDVTGIRLVLSTPTAGGTFAAYASVIDNTTNDPRTLLPS